MCPEHFFVTLAVYWDVYGQGKISVILMSRPHSRASSSAPGAEIMRIY